MIESVIFHESTAGPGKTVTLEKLLTESWCKNKYKRQIHLSKTIRNDHHDWRLKLFTHGFSDVWFASHTIIKDSNSEFLRLDEKVKVYNYP